MIKQTFFFAMEETHVDGSGAWTSLMTLGMAMLVGSYLAGLIPLAMRLSAETRRWTTALGAGLLVGTALAVIIPEGVNSIYMSAGSLCWHISQRHFFFSMGLFSYHCCLFRCPPPHDILSFSFLYCVEWLRMYVCVFMDI